MSMFSELNKKLKLAQKGAFSWKKLKLARNTENDWNWLKYKKLKPVKQKQKEAEIV